MSAPLEVMQAQTGVAALKTAGGWLVLALDGLRLALPQREIRLIALTGDLTAPERDTAPEVGTLARADGLRWPAFSLDGTLALEPRPSRTRRSCVFFETNGAVRGLVCDRLWSLATDAELTAEPVPGCLRVRRSPITGFGRYRDGLVAVTRAADLASYLDFLLEDRHDAAE